MSKRKDQEASLQNNPNWQRANKLTNDIQDLIRQIQILDLTIAKMQKDKAEAEFYGKQTNPFFSKRFFRITKMRDRDVYYLEPSDYYSDQAIRVSEAELIILREFKNQRLNNLNEEVRNLSNEINHRDIEEGDEE